MASSSGMMVFALETGREYAERVARRLEVPLSPHEERAFEDGEHKTRPLVDVHGADVFVIDALAATAGRSPNDQLCRLLFFIGALKDAGAARVTAAVPYLCYARKDRRTQANDPVTTKYVARMFEACGTDAVLTFDVHNLAAFENAFRCLAENLEAIPLFVDHFAPICRKEKVAVISPDIGGAKRAERFRRALGDALRDEPSAGFVEKRRAGGVVSGQLLVGDVRDRTVILFDDLISTGTTLRRAAEICRDSGASRIFAAATHGLLLGSAFETLAPPALDGVVIADTVRPLIADRGALPEHVVTLDSSALLVAAILAARRRR
jgi:ribose-phosphate pyrophosphokinase